MLCKVKLALAREAEHPNGDDRIGYEIVVPLDSDGRISASEWKDHRADCMVRFFRPGMADRTGQLKRRGAKSWYVDYDAGLMDDQLGFRLDREHFIVGEYVSIKDRDGKMHTYHITRVEPLKQL